MVRRANRTLWSANGSGIDGRLLDYTATEDRPWDARLLRWDVVGSLGHVEGLKASGLLSNADYTRLRRGLRRALAAVDAGRLAVGLSQEDVHTAIEEWLTRRLPGSGERLHTGRSRNDQVATDLRLYLKDCILTLHSASLGLVDVLLQLAGRNRRTLWPG